MTKNEHFEKLQLYTGINYIAAPNYPEDFPLHWHQYVEIIALPNDAVITEPPVVRINHTPFSLTPGDILFTWTGELHEIVSNKDRQLIAIQFPGATINELQEFVPYLNSFRSIHHINHFELPELSKNMMEHLIKLREFSSSTLIFKNVEMRICLYQMFIQLGLYVKQLNRQSVSGGMSNCSYQTIDKMNQACIHINENCDRPLSLDSIANLFGFSIYYFSRVFKLATGYNFTEYLTIQRVKKAQTLLAESDLNITEIAFQSGFKSISSFNRAFRQIRGCSPSDYRKYLTTE
ncbi:MAG: helix-turn-helix domain-containing protein [Lachnospiraceae bacterium]|nr:helix-turn-helix domain-containing protein [Lachnospiraceae bacterium]